MIEADVCPNCGTNEKFKKHIVGDIDIDIEKKKMYINVIGVIILVIILLVKKNGLISIEQD